MSTRHLLPLVTLAFALLATACSNPMRPRQELDTYCRALGITEGDPALRASHQAQMTEIQRQLREAKVTKDFAKLVAMAAPLHPTQIHDALSAYADLNGLNFSCTKVQQQRRRRVKEKEERLKAVREDGGDAEDMEEARNDPSYTAPFDVKDVQAKVDAYLQALRK